MYNYNYSNYNQIPNVMNNNIDNNPTETYPNYSVTTSNYSPRLFNSYDGFIRGNMFPDEYEPYSTVEPYPLIPANEREAMLNKVRECKFAALDLNLYLDTHPDDAEKIKAYNQCIMQGKQMLDEFERNYGPITLDSETLNTYPWTWIMSPWPWEV